jgi:fatty acid desaturase
MQPNDPPRSKSRESFLALLLAALFGGGFLLFLILVSGGFFFYVLCAAAAVMALGFLHYALWGHAFSREVEGEREEEALRQREEEMIDKPQDGASFRRRF